MTVDAAALAALFRTPSIYIAGLLVLFIAWQMHRASADRPPRAGAPPPPAAWAEQLLLVAAAVAVLLLVALIGIVLHRPGR